MYINYESKSVCSICCELSSPIINDSNKNASLWKHCITLESYEYCQGLPILHVVSFLLLYAALIPSHMVILNIRIC